MKINKKHMIYTIVLMIIFIFCGTYGIMAAQMRAHAPMTFDENGRLSFTAVDNAAVNIAYKTIGWTIKRYDLPINHEENMTITCTLNSESHTDENGKVYTTFYVEKSEILLKAKEISPEWCEEMAVIGGIAYLDNIMTVCEYGENKGELREDGSFTGEVYFDYQGISTARNWRNPSDLKQYFDRVVVIPPDKAVKPGENEDRDETYKTSYYNCDENGLKVAAKGQIYSDNYEVSRAIPSGEPVYALGEFSKYAYKLDYRKITGQKDYTVCVNVSATLQWNDLNGTVNEEDISYEDYYTVTRSYTAYQLNYITLYNLKKWNIHNDIFGNVSIGNDQLPTLEKYYNFYIQEPVYQENIYIDEGVIAGGNHRPSFSFADYSGAAENAVGEFVTGSDIVAIDGTIILSGNGATPPERDSTIELIQTIPTVNEVPNGAKESYSSYIYAIAEGTGGYSIQDLELNNVVVHTPVVSNGYMQDNIQDNQMLEPVRDCYSMVLDRNFWINVGNYGSHIDEKGYGNRDYSAFAKDNQVQFPFDVVQNNRRIPAFTWISVGKNHENNQFYLPVDVVEGEYTVNMRSLARNCNENSYNSSQINANTNMDNYVANSSCQVYISGQLREFEIMDISDKNYKKINKAALSVNKLPIRNPALRQGHGFWFELTTVGDNEEEEYVLIEPTYKLIPYDNSEPVAVDLYILTDHYNGRYTFDKLTNQLDRDFLENTETDETGHIRKWSGYYNIPANVYAVPKGYDLTGYYEENILNNKSDLWLKKGYIVVNFDISTVRRGEKYLNYYNKINYPSGYCNKWEQEGYQLRDYFMYGDIVLYFGERNFMEDYEIVGTH